MELSLKVRPAEARDVDQIARINAEVFLGDRDRVDGAREWMACLFNAYPLYQYFVIEVDGSFAGYAGWQLHGGFHRAEPVIELDQLGIDRKHQGQGLGPQLMHDCITRLTAWIQTKNDRIESHISFVVWGYVFNFDAMPIYAQAFGDGVCGFRKQFGDRGENMLRLRVPFIRPIRKGPKQEAR